MRFSFRSIKTKVLFWFTTATVFILMLFNVAIYFFIEQNTKLSIQNNLYNKAVFINKSLMADIHIQELIKDDALKDVDVAIVKDNKFIFKKGKTNFLKFKPYIANKKSFFVFNKGENLDGLYILKVHYPFNGAIFFYEHHIDEKIDVSINQIKEILFFLEPILLFLLIFMVSKVTDKILKSINNITKTANQIYVTDFSNEIPAPKYDDEIKDLVDSFNKMIKRLKEGVTLLEQFNSDVSHELKTPLTVIKGEIEITLNKKRDSEYYEKSLKVIEDETKQIQNIVDDLLLLTKYTKENIKQTFAEVSLDSILLSTIDKFNIQLKEKNIKLHIEKFEPLNMNGNSILLTTIFSNLIDNAIKYSSDDTNIFISLYKGKVSKKIHFIVKDEGFGIAKECLSKLTDRFYRVDKSRNKKIKGFGLGLSIVKNSIDLHNGEIKFKSKEGEGTKVKVIF